MSNLISENKAAKPKEEKQRQYAICKERGHEITGIWTGEWTSCKYCETELRYENIMHERKTP